MNTYVVMKTLESAPARYDLGIRILTLGKLDKAYDRLTHHIDDGLRVLDVGCGIGALIVHAAAKKEIGDRITLMGNTDTNAILQLGSAEDAKKACKIAIEAAAPDGGFFLSGGCEIRRDMPYQNMRAMLMAAQEY
jgi:uroporphyrinogen-III decarboxylase